MDAQNIDNGEIMLYVVLRMTFVISAFAMGYLDKMTRHDH